MSSDHDPLATVASTWRPLVHVVDQCEPHICRAGNLDNHQYIKPCTRIHKYVPHLLIVCRIKLSIGLWTVQTVQQPSFNQAVWPFQSFIWSPVTRLANSTPCSTNRLKFCPMSPMNMNEISFPSLSLSLFFCWSVDCSDHDYMMKMTTTTKYVVHVQLMDKSWIAFSCRITYNLLHVEYILWFRFLGTAGWILNGSWANLSDFFFFYFIFLLCVLT